MSEDQQQLQLQLQQQLAQRQDKQQLKCGSTTSLATDYSV